MKKSRFRFNRYWDIRPQKRRFVWLAVLWRRSSAWFGAAGRYFFVPRLRISRFQLNLFGLTFLSLGLVVGTYFTVSDLIPRLRAATSPWDQTDWSGGDGQQSWLDATKFDSSSNVETAVSGEVTLSRIEELTNTGFEADLSDWEAGARPDSISGLKAWYAADQIGGLIDNDPVGTWSDLSGNGHDVSNTGTARPTYKTGIQNGLPVVRFDGTDDLLNTSGFGYDGSNTEITILFVGTRRASIVGGGSIITLSGGDTFPWQGWGQGAFFWEHQDNGYKLNIRRADAERAKMDTLTTQDTFNLLTALVNDNYHRIYLNGVLDGQSIVSPGAFNSGWFWIGATPNGGSGHFFKQWDIAEVIVYDSALSAADRIKVETYLANKYSVSVSSSNHVFDSFTGTDGTALTSHSPDIPGSGTYVAGGEGGFQIAEANNAESIVSNHTASVFNAGASAVDVRAELTWPNPVAGGDGGLALNHIGLGGADRYKYYALRTADNGGLLRITRQWDGVVLASKGYSITSGLHSFRGTIDSSGNIKFYIDGTLELSATDTTETGTFQGIDGYNPQDIRWDNLTVDTVEPQTLTVTRDTVTTYGGSTGSAKLVATADANFTQVVNVGDTNSYNLEAFAYTDGSAVTSADVELFYNGATISTSYTLVGGGWYRLNGTVVGAAVNREYGVQVKSGKTVYLDNFGLYSYPSSGTLVSSIFDGDLPTDWGTLTYTATTPSGTSVEVRIRTSDSATMAGAPAFSTCTAISSGSDISANGCVTDTHRYVQYELTLAQTDQTKTPTFEDFSLTFSTSDVTPPPTNASTTLMYRSNGGAQLSSNDWTNGSDPYFTWTAGADEGGGSGLRGYCLYLGTDSAGDPATAKGLLGTSPVDTTGTTCQFIVSVESVDFANASYKGGTWLSTSNSPYYLNIKAVDNAGNVFSGASEQFQFRFDDTPPANPAFISTPGDFVSTYEVSITWPTSAPDAPSDANSGVAGLQYRISSSGTWYGDLHTGTQDASDLLTNDGVYTTIETPDYDGLGTDDLVEGNNTIFFRTWDAAGNVITTYVSAGIKINTSAPSAPQNLDVSPDTNTVNSFAFSWDPPVTFVGQAANITYCYTVNTLPSASTCTFTSAGVTSLPADAFASQPGSNTFYLVAKDEAGNINYAVLASGEFTANTAAPGIPTNVEIVDASIKETSAWKLALAWEPPGDVGAGVASYKVYRSATTASCSTDFGSFANISTTTGTAFLDSGLEQTNYYYCVKACDSANNCSAVSSTATEFPTGKWKVPADLTSGPVASPVTTRRAVIAWTTERGSDSKVAFGTASGSYFDEEPSIAAQVTSHSITLTNLNPGTTYFYKARWTDEDGNTGESSERTFTTQPAPTIKDTVVSAINIDSAIVNFTSTNASKVRIYYGPTTSFGGMVEQETAATESRYQVQLSGLLDGTKYYYKINPFDSEGIEYDSVKVDDFTTYPRPRITNVRFQEIPAATSTIEVSWESNTPISSIVTFSPRDGSSQSRDVVKLTRTAGHRVQVSGLRPSTVYTLTARGFDAIGNEAVSDPQRFTTATDTRPPVISNVLIETSIQGIGSDARAQVIISWETDEPATGQLEYGAGAGSTYSNRTPEDPSLIFYHLQVITDLSPSEVYHLRILTKDEAGNEATGTDYVVITLERTDSALDLIITNLAETFRFLGGFGRLFGR